MGRVLLHLLLQRDEHRAQIQPQGVIDMLADAISGIRCADEAALLRRYTLLSRRHPLDLVDSWLSELEALMLQDNQVVPEPLITEIARFLERLDTRLYRRLQRNGDRETSLVLDLLFEAEERLLVRLVATG
jgi:hypothetical protein